LCFKCEGLKALKCSLRHSPTISHLMENEGEKKERYRRGKSAWTNPLHLSHLHRITHAHSPATFALSLSRSLICWMRFTDYCQSAYSNRVVSGEIDYTKIILKQQELLYRRKSPFTITYRFKKFNIKQSFFYLSLSN